MGSAGTHTAIPSKIQRIAETLASRFILGKLYRRGHSARRWTRRRFGNDQPPFSSRLREIVYDAPGPSVYCSATTGVWGHVQATLSVAGPVEVWEPNN